MADEKPFVCGAAKHPLNDVADLKFHGLGYPHPNGISTLITLISLTKKLAHNSAN
jgi:hypothetical protein